MTVVRATAVLIFFLLAAARLSAADPQQVVARDGDIVVTVEDVQRYFRDRVPASRRGDFLSRNDAVSRLTASLLLIRSLGAEAAASGEVAMEMVEWQLDLYRDRLMMNYYLDALVADKTASVDWVSTASEVYTAEPEAFRAPERVRASHILIKPAERGDDEARALAEEILKQLNDGADFTEMAAEFSEDPTVAKNNGDLGTFGRGKMVPAFEDAVFALREPGELAGPVKTKFGYHIIRLAEYLPARQRPFDDVKAEIVETLKKEIPNTLRQNKILEVRSSEIDYDTELMDELVGELREQLSKPKPSGG